MKKFLSLFFLFCFIACPNVSESDAQAKHIVESKEEWQAAFEKLENYKIKSKSDEADVIVLSYSVKDELRNLLNNYSNYYSQYQKYESIPDEDVPEGYTKLEWFQLCINRLTALQTTLLLAFKESSFLTVYDFNTSLASCGAWSMLYPSGNGWSYDGFDQIVRDLLKEKGHYYELYNYQKLGENDKIVSSVYGVRLPGSDDDAWSDFSENDGISLYDTTIKPLLICKNVYDNATYDEDKDMYELDIYINDKNAGEVKLEEDTGDGWRKSKLLVGFDSEKNIAKFIVEVLKEKTDDKNNVLLDDANQIVYEAKEVEYSVKYITTTFDDFIKNNNIPSIGNSTNPD